MKCPYRDFQECIVEQCPSCNYEIEEYITLDGIKPSYWSDEYAIKMGAIWTSKKERYKFVSCKLIEGGVQPIPVQKQVINNTQKTSVVIRKSIF